MADNSIVRRSWLIAPAHDAGAVEQAQASLPDVLVLDLEYTVPPKYKEAARSALCSTISSPAPRVSEVFVRVDWETRWCDIEAAVCPGLKGIVLPGPESAEEVAELDRLIGDVERKKGVIPDSVELVLILESPRGFWNSRALAGSSRRVTGLGIGRADLTMGLGPDPDGEFHLYPYLMSTVVTAARAHNIQAIGAHWKKGSRGGVASPKDTFEAARRAWRMGFTGSLCARPEQVAPVNEGFTPPQAEVKKAEKIWAAFQRGKQAGQNRVAVGGRYYDAGKAGRCQDIVLWAQCCARRDEDKKILIRVEGEK